MESKPSQLRIIYETGELCIGGWDDARIEDSVDGDRMRSTVELGAVDVCGFVQGHEID